MQVEKIRRAFIIANGEPDYPERLEVGAEDLIVCADGGSNHVDRLGVKPHIIVGDLDSIAEPVLQAFEKNGVSIRKHPREKDESDLELAIEEAVRTDPEEIVCVAVFGGRPDHALTNVSLLGRYAEKGRRVTVLGKNWRALFVTVAAAAQLDGKKGDLLSLVPLSSRIESATVDGAKWRLVDADLTWGNSLTLSNEFAGSRVNVSIRGGLLLVFHIYV